jgi:hypothetical protein
MGTNSLAYFASSSVTKKKKGFSTLTPGYFQHADGSSASAPGDRLWIPFRKQCLALKKTFFLTSEIG